MAKNIDTILIRNADERDFGGAERYTVFLAKELQSSGMRILIMSHHKTLKDFARDQQVNYQESPYLHWQNFSGWRNLLLPFYVLWQGYLTLNYYFIFKKYKVRNIHLHSRDDFIAGTIAGSWLGCNIIWSDHADLKHVFLNTQLKYKNFIGKWVLKLSAKTNKIILISQSEKREILNHVPQNHQFWTKTTVIYNGVNDEFRQLPPSKTITEKFIFGNIGRLVIDKGVSECIEAFQKVHKTYSQTELWLIGGGANIAPFVSLADNNPAIKFMGHQNQPLKLMAQTDCMLIPSYHEGLGMSVIESCMMEKPIVASNIGGIPEVITDGVSGLLIPPKSIEPLYKAMIKIIDDPVFAQKLAKNARQSYLKKFVFTDVVRQQILPLYKK